MHYASKNQFPQQTPQSRNVHDAGAVQYAAFLIHNCWSGTGEKNSTYVALIKTCIAITGSHSIGAVVHKAGKVKWHENSWKESQVPS